MAEPSYQTPDYDRFACGCREISNPLGTGQVYEFKSRLCLDCRRGRIGRTIDFVRFGAVPAAGVSRNHRDGVDEDGLSVYEVAEGKAVLVGWHFDFLDRPAFLGTGTIVGWGSDCEPVVRVESIRKARKPEVRRLLAGA